MYYAHTASALYLFVHDAPIFLTAVEAIHFSGACAANCHIYDAPGSHTHGAVRNSQFPTMLSSSCLTCCCDFPGNLKPSPERFITHQQNQWSASDGTRRFLKVSGRLRFIACVHPEVGRRWYVGLCSSTRCRVAVCEGSEWAHQQRIKVRDGMQPSAGRFG